MSSLPSGAPRNAIALIGMSGRFPGARNVREFWQNQLNGVESISHFRADELEVPNAAELARKPNYVKARSILDDIDLFDPEFFGIYPREAELMDPQHRLFLECCWESFEDAGYDPFAYPGAVGVYAGCSMPFYFLTRLCPRDGFIQQFAGGYQVEKYSEMLGNSLDFLATRVSYKLNLRGPSFTLQAGCSTSLVAVCQACQSLLTYQCDMALAGGASIPLPQKRGSFYQEGGMISPDGHCRAFDADAQGTVFGSGVAVVLLKRAEEALRDGDQIYAVIRGFATNNDGSSKVGYTAPSVDGQARVIALAQSVAGVHPESIGYIEAHGTGTPLGDPIEVAALTQAFRHRTSRKGFCALGTVKTNVGHLDVAAGITGLIHAAHVVRDGILPPTLHFHRPNPKLDLGNSPFYINSKAIPWETQSARVAGVSAFGIGGTNAHVVLEQAPPRARRETKKSSQLLVLSARSESALERSTDNFLEHVKANPSLNLADTAWTLQVGRRPFAYRRSVVIHDLADAISTLSQQGSTRVKTCQASRETPSVHFLFPGQGAQYPNMGRELYETEKVFRQGVDKSCDILQHELGLDLRTLLYPQTNSSSDIATALTNTIYAQPAIFVIECALAQLWMSWGIRPAAMLGHSVGEFVAAHLAGVLSLEDGLRLIAARAKLMQELPSGGMLSVRLPEAELRRKLDGNLTIAAVNAPSQCVVAGPFAVLDAFEEDLAANKTAFRRLPTSHAFHSSMMDPIIDTFAGHVAQVRLSPPRIPFISGVTGTWITDHDATDPSYWARHLRQPVQFSAGVKELLKRTNSALVEVGPGTTLSTLAIQHLLPRHSPASDSLIVSSFDKSSVGQERAEMLEALASLWRAGVEPNWRNVHSHEPPQRISLPTYPFERKRHWLETQSAEAKPTHAISAHSGLSDIDSILPEEHRNVNVTVDSAPQSQSSIGRATSISATLRDIFEDLSGAQIPASSDSATFLELGFDSLFLTQIAQALQSKFNLSITFRQLLGEESTLKSLAEYIDKNAPSNLPAPALASMITMDPTPSPQQTTTMQTSITPEKPSQPVDRRASSPNIEWPVERLVREQLSVLNQLFTKQLEAVSQLNSSADSATPTASPTSSLPLESVPTRSLAPPQDHVAQRASTSPTESKLEKQEQQEFKPFGPYKPPQAKKDFSHQLTPQQRTHLNALIERYTKRTAKSKSMTQEHRLPLADPRVVSGFRPQWKEMVYPIVTVRSKGSRLWDVDGNEYIDLLSGFGPIMLGHRPDFVEKAIERQLHEGFEIGPQTPLAGEVATLFCEMTGNERMTFCNTGSEAVMAALRVARTVSGRDKVVLFAGAYHGMFDEVLVKGLKKGGSPHTLPIAPGIPRESVGNIVVLEYGAPESLDWIRTHASELAAVLTEPVQSRHPALQPREFLRELRRITSDSGTALIFDEVVTGFRVHPGGCQALFDIRADLATYGKVLAGGMPIGVLAGKAQFMDALDGGAWQFGDDSYPSAGVTFFAGTFVRHPLALAAAKAVLLHLREQGPHLQEALNAQTHSLVRSLNDLFESNQVPAPIENFGSILYFSFPPDFSFGSLLYYHLREKGLFLLEGFPCFLTTAHTEGDLRKVVDAFEESIAEMQSGGILPQPATRRLSPQPPIEQPEFVDVAPKGESHSDLSPFPAEIAGPTSPAEAPLTEAQLEIWLSAQLSDEASCAYNESFTLHLRGSLNEIALRESLNQVLSRHEGLRASIVPERNVLHFSPELNIQLALEDLSPATPAERATRLEAVKQEEARTPFDVINGPVIRARLLCFEPQHHALIVTAHHLFCDGWSTNILLDELGKSYSARLRKTRADLASPFQFSVYSQEQERNTDTKDVSETAEYWLERFRDPVQPLELPYDRPRPAVKSFKGATFRTRIDSATYQDIKRSGARQGCTLVATLLSGFISLLHRLSGQTDIVVGIPAAGQSLLERGPLVGHCVNFLPIRSRLVEQQTAAELMKQVKRTLLDAYDHQTFTYGTLVRKLKLRRDPSRLPLVEVQFNLEKIGSALDFADLQAEVDPNPKASVNFDLFLNVVESKEGLLIDCDYNADLFDPQTIFRWLGHLETLLKAIASDANRPIALLPILSDKERQRMLVDWNTTTREYPRTQCVHHLIGEQCLRTPDTLAVTYAGQSLTYAELDSRSNRLARYLVKIGVTPGSLVGVAVERSLEMLVALLGIWKAGAAYLPIDPNHPRERLEYILENASISTLLTHSKLVANLPALDTHLVCLDRDWILIGREAETNPNVSISSDSTAYTIYTSGSTGKPKGVEVTHRNVANLLCSMKSQPGLQPHDRLLAVTTLSFDIAALELFLPLTSGAQLIVASRESSVDGRMLLKLIKESQATVLQATPATWRLLLEAGWAGAPGFKILCGGEALPRDLANQLITCGEVWNMYGPTETTIWSATSRVEAGDGPVTIGPPIHNTQFYVLDARQQPVPIGVPSELYIGGDGVARGYFKNPTLTAERFVPDTFRKDPSGRMYKTGDLVRYRPDGTLEFLGRLDNQVKVRGFRIELGEIESVLAKHPDIRDCAVVPQEDEPGLKRLIAYLVPNETQKPSSDDLRDWVGASLPEYMVPSIFTCLPALPHTPNGKVDRKALAQLNCNNLPDYRSFVAPRDETEKLLANICAEVLQLPQVSVVDSLFDLGADSVQLFQIIARAAHQGLGITPQQILRLRSVSALASELALQNGQSKPLERIPPLSRENYRLTAASEVL